MRWFGARASAIVSTLVDDEVLVGTPEYRGTVPLHGEWELLRAVAFAGAVTDPGEFHGFGCFGGFGAGFFSLKRDIAKKIGGLLIGNVTKFSSVFVFKHYDLLLYLKREGECPEGPEY